MPDNEPIDHELIQFVMDLVKLSIQIRDRTLSKEAAFQEWSKLRKNAGCKISPFDPFELASMNYLDKVQRNLQLLTKLDIQNPALYFSALWEEERVIIPSIKATHLPILKYFIKQPMGKMTYAARELEYHPETVSRALSSLKKNNYLRTMGILNRWAFGLRSFVLLFNLSPEVTSAEFFKSMNQYPFFNSFYEDKINQNHYLSFLLPHDCQVVSEFVGSFRKLASSIFLYWDLQEATAYGFSDNMDTLTVAGWSFPEELSEGMEHPELPNDFKPMISRCKRDTSLSSEDFVIANYLSGNCRLTSKDICALLLHHDTTISPSSAYKRKRKILARRIIIPYTYWVSEFESYLRVEITGSLCAQNSFLAAALKVPRTMYYITTDSLILWLSVPTEHIKRYVQFFVTNSKLENVGHIRMVIGKYYMGSRMALDIVKDWGFGPKGYTVEGLDINPDVTDYILF
jgi:hypothetical protein